MILRFFLRIFYGSQDIDELGKLFTGISDKIEIIVFGAVGAT